MSAARLDVVRLARRRRRARDAGGGEGIVFIDRPDCLLRARVLARHPTARPTLVIVPDAPNAIEHYDALIRRLGRLANERPESIAGLAIVQAAGWEEEKRWIRRIDPKRQMSRPLVGQAICGLTSRRLSDTWYEAALGPGTPKEAFKATSREVLGRGGCFCLASLIQANRDAEPDLPPVAQPALVLWGTKDRTHSRTEKRTSLELAPAARYVEFPDSGHSPDLEQEERFADLALGLAAEAGL